MTERLPLFPLDLVLFPGTHVPLHIFEPRYRLMVRRCAGENLPFGVVLLQSGSELGATGIAVPRLVGTSARIIAVQGLPDGRSFVVAEGERRFTIDRLIRDAEPYLVGEIGWLDEPEGDGVLPAASAAAEAYATYLLAAETVTAESGGETSIESPTADLAPGPLSYQIAASLPIPTLDRQRLLEALTATERLRAELDILKREIRLMQDLLVRLRADTGGSNLN